MVVSGGSLACTSLTTAATLGVLAVCHVHQESDILTLLVHVLPSLPIHCGRAALQPCILTCVCFESAEQHCLCNGRHLRMGSKMLEAASELNADGRQWPAHLCSCMLTLADADPDLGGT